MSKQSVLEHIKNIEELAKDEGLDFFPVIFEYVNRDIMLEACSYGLPIRSRHWSFGRSYQTQKIYGEMGLSKVYEIVFNNDPAYAFLLDTNPDIINIMVGAHVFGHCHFFKHNVMFKNSDRNMIYKAAERASRVDSYIEQYGLDKVEHLMDIGFALDNHIDWVKGVHREKYPQRVVLEKKNHIGEFEDLLNIGDYSKRSIKKVVTGDKLPPSPEKDLLWFLVNYAPLDEWEKDTLEIIREESYYFYPIVMTKIANEGFACVIPDTLVFTENGIMEMKDVVENKPVIFDGELKQNVVHSGMFKNRDTIRIHTNSGITLCGANNHRILNSAGKWKQLDELMIGDTIKVSGGNDSWTKEYCHLNFSPAKKAQSKTELCKKYRINYSTYNRYKNKRVVTKQGNIKVINKIDKIINDEKKYTSCMGNRKRVTIPNIVDEDLGRFLGYIIGDGHISIPARSIGLTTGDDYSKDDFIQLVNTLFEKNVVARWDNSSKNGRWRINVYSKTIIDFLTNYLNLCSGVSASQKSVPPVILKSPKSVVSSFIRSYFDSDGCASTKQGIILGTSSNKLAEQIQVILLNYGILSRRKKEKDGCWQLRITGISAKKFYEEIGFGLERKQEKLKQYIGNHKQWKKEKWEDKITEIEYCGRQDVYDISVENSHRYAAAGFINHNSFWHAELMNKYKGITDGEFIEFSKCHSGVVQPGSPLSINPYYLGFRVFTDIREKWDKMYEEGKSCITGIQKVIQVAVDEDDVSFLRNYLTVELATEMGLFNYGYKLKRNPDMKKKDLREEHGIVELKDRDLNKIIDHITRPTLNYGAPAISVVDVDGDTLVLKHEDKLGPLDEKYTKKTMEYIFELWGAPVELETYDYDGLEFTYCFDESGFDII